MKEIHVTEIPPCDFAEALPDLEGEHGPGLYDAPTKRNSPGRGSWANLCQVCFSLYGIDSSITSKRVLTTAVPVEVPQDVEDLYETAMITEASGLDASQELILLGAKMSGGPDEAPEPTAEQLACEHKTVAFNVQLHATVYVEQGNPRISVNIEPWVNMDFYIAGSTVCAACDLPLGEDTPQAIGAQLQADLTGENADWVVLGVTG